MRNASHFWTDEKVERLKALIRAEQAYSSADMGQMLGCSRNAVIGKVHRLGLSLKLTSATNEKTVRRSAKELRKELLAKMLAAKELEMERPKGRVPPLQLNLSKAGTEPHPEPLKDAKGAYFTVVTVGNTQCHFPYGDPAKHEFHYCGHPGYPWCEFHRKICFTPALGPVKISLGQRG